MKSKTKNLLDTDVTEEKNFKSSNINQISRIFLMDNHFKVLPQISLQLYNPKLKSEQ